MRLTQPQMQAVGGRSGWILAGVTWIVVWAVQRMLRQAQKMPVRFQQDSFCKGRSKPLTPHPNNLVYPVLAMTTMAAA